MIERSRLRLIERLYPQRYRLLRTLEALATGKAPENFESGALVFIGRQETVGTAPYIGYIQRASDEKDINIFYLFARGDGDLRRAEIISQTLCSDGHFKETDRIITQPRRTDQESVPQGIFCLRRITS